MSKLLDIKYDLDRHVEALESEDLLPDNWKWYPEKIRRLRKIDENLINDVIALHKSTEDNPEKYRKLHTLLHILQEDLQSMTSYGRVSKAQKSQADAVNLLIKAVDTRIHEYIQDLLGNADRKKIQYLKRSGFDVDRYPNITKLIIENWQLVMNAYKAAKKKLSSFGPWDYELTEILYSLTELREQVLTDKEFFVALLGLTRVFVMRDESKESVMDIYNFLSAYKKYLTPETLKAITQLIKSTNRDIETGYLLKKMQVCLSQKLSLIDISNLLIKLFKKYGKTLWIIDNFPFGKYMNASKSYLYGALDYYLKQHTKNSHQLYKELSQGKKYHINILNCDLTQKEMVAIIEGIIPLCYYHANRGISEENPLADTDIVSILNAGHFIPPGILFFNRLKKTIYEGELGDNGSISKVMGSKLTKNKFLYYARIADNHFGDKSDFTDIKSLSIPVKQFHEDIFGNKAHLSIRSISNRLDSFKTRLRHQQLSDFKKGKFVGEERHFDVPGRDQWFVFFAAPLPFISRETFHTITNNYGPTIFEFKPELYKKVNWMFVAPGGSEYRIQSPSKGRMTHDIIISTDVKLKDYLNRIYVPKEDVVKTRQVLRDFGYDVPVLSSSNHEKNEMKALKEMKTILNNLISRK
jgi:hypothetical protein